MIYLSLPGMVFGILVSSGLITLAGSVRKVHQWERVAQITSDRRRLSHDAISIDVGTGFLNRLLCNRPRSPWLSDQDAQQALRRALSSKSLHQFRQSQILYGASAAVVMALWCALRTLTGHPLSMYFAPLVILCAFVGGGWFVRWNLRQSAEARLRMIEQELPVITDLLAFAVAAGEPVVVALRRMCDSCAGEFIRELERVLISLAAGISLIVSLEDMDRTLRAPAVSRLVRAITVALERGTPMALVLRAQASDSRAEAARTLLVTAGKKETMMMIPVVFLILPLIVAVALYPGLVALNILHN